MHERLRTRIEEVTSRQLEVARLVAEGRTNPEIASELGITLDGAKYHVSELLGRLGLERREEIAEWYRSERRGQRVRRFSALFASAPRAFATAATVTAVVALGALLAVGLSGGRAQEPAAATPAPTVSPPAAIELGSAPPLGAGGDASDMPENLDQLRFILGQRLRSEAPEVVSWERVDWTNGCFDLTYPGGCPLSVSPVPGYRVTMHLGDDEYVLRTDLNVGRYRLQAAPAVPPFDIVFEWRDETAFLCLEVGLAADGRGSVAGCGEPGTPVNLGQSGVGSAAILDWLRSRSTFELGPQTNPGNVLPTGVTMVVGAGDEAPGHLARAALEWGRHLAVESYTGRSSAAMALAIGWRDDNAEGCTNLQVMRYGVAYLSGCPEASDGAVFLNDEQLTRLYEWTDGYQPFVDFVVLPDHEMSLIFSGDGAEVASEAVQAEIREWLQSPPWAPATSVE